MLEPELEPASLLTIRRDDLRAIACILDTTEDGAVKRLDELGLALVR
jgi:hypothetical protein